MKTNESASLYRYCIVLVSTLAGSNFSPERKLRSSTAPVSRFLTLVRVKAAPLPGLTNWNSTTTYGAPSIMIFSPLRMSDVSYVAMERAGLARGLATVNSRQPDARIPSDAGRVALGVVRTELAQEAGGGLGGTQRAQASGRVAGV